MLTINNITAITSLLSLIVIFASSIFVLYKNPRSQLNRYYVFFATMGFGIVFGMFGTYAFPDGPHLLLYSRILQASTVCYFASYLTLSYAFPKPEKRIRLFPVILQLIPALATSIVILFTDLNVSAAWFENGRFMRKYGIFYNYYVLIGLGYFCIGTYNFVRRYIKTDVYVYRLQMRYFFTAIFIGMSATNILSLILPRFFNYTLLYGLSPSFTTICVIGALFYTIVAYNLMDIATVVHKTVMYSFISAAVFIPLASLVFLYNMNLRWLANIPLGVFILVLVSLFIFFTYFIQPVIDRAFKRRQYAFQGMVDDLIRKVGEMREIDSIIRHSVNILVKSMGLKGAAFFLYNSDSRQFEPYSVIPLVPEGIDPLDRNSIVVRWFARNPEILARGHVYTDDMRFADIREEMAEFFTSYVFRLVIPLYHDRRLVGLLCLREKESLDGFSPAEIETLAFFQKECNQMISTALMYEEGMRKQMVSRTRDLSSYILSRSVPSFLPNFENIRFGGFMIPRYVEGTDYYDFIRLGNQGIGMIVTDMQGYGVPQSLHSVVLRASFQSSIHDAPSSYNVIRNLNHVLCDYTGAKGEGVNAFYAFFDVKNSRLMYTNAGYQPLDIFRVETRVFDSLDSEGSPLGIKGEANYGIGRTNLLKGDIGVFYSRSMIMSKNQHGEEFGLMRIRSMVREYRNSHPTEIARRIKQAFESFLGLSSPASDVLLLVFKVV